MSKFTEGEYLVDVKTTTVEIVRGSLVVDADGNQHVEVYPAESVELISAEVEEVYLADGPDDRRGDDEFVTGLYTTEFVS